MEFVVNATDFKLPIFNVCPIDFDFVKNMKIFEKQIMELNFLYALAWSKNYTLDFLFQYLMTMTLAYYGNDRCWLKINY